MVKHILRRILCVSIVICIAITLSGCSLYIASLDKLLRAPMSDPDIEKTISKKLGSSVTLLAPSLKEDDTETEYLSSTLNYADLDSDGKDEVICFYSEKSSPEKIHVLILKNVESKWEIVSDTIGSGNEISSLMVVELSDSANKQIVTTWKVVESKILNISSFSTASNGVEPLCEDMRFDEIEMVDVDSDDYSEMLVINYDTATHNDEKKSFLSLLDIDPSGEIVTLGQADLPGDCDSFEMNFSNGSAETPFALFLDYKDALNVCRSSVYYWDVTAGRLVNISDGADVKKINSSAEKYTSKFNTARIFPSKCADVNNDGIYEIPFSQSFSQNEMLENRLAYTQWNTIVFSKDGTCAFSDTGSEKRVYVDDVNYLKIPAYFESGKFYAFSKGDDRWVFNYGEFANAGQAFESESSCFAEIISVGDNEIENCEKNGYSLLGSYSEKTGVSLVMRITDYGSAMGLKKEDIFNIK